MKLHRIGLKLYSTNLFYIQKALELHGEGVFGYLELYVVPGSREGCLEAWKGAGLPVVLHAPHYYSGFNFSLKENEGGNRELLAEVDTFGVALKPMGTIFHPGVNGSCEETIRQIKIFKMEFPALFETAFMENKPKVGLKGEACVGASPEEIRGIIDETGMGFCFDVRHAVSYSAWAGGDFFDLFDRFMELRPAVYHLCDGHMDSITDSHLNFGEGDMDLKRIVGEIPYDSLVSIETQKEPSRNLQDFRRDVGYYLNLLKSQD